MHDDIRHLLARVEKPYRLIGGEAGACTKRWDEARVRFCLAFPDVYEIGMSHLGLAILYDILNAREGVLAERVFAPWGDVERELGARGMKLFSLESHRPLDAFDVIGITLPYELTYTNALAVLAAGGIAPRAADRGSRDPLVIAGGPGAFNPAPVEAFFDAVVVGDGEDVVVDIARIVDEGKRAGHTRDDIVGALAAIRGVYVPRLRGGRRTRIRKAVIADLDGAPYPARAVAAHAAVQDRAAVEIQRGCVRGCRFCQAGTVYRPVRQRSPATVARLARSQLAAGGHTDLSLLSLSVGDYACLEDVLAAIGDADGDVCMSLPSLRSESLTQGVLEWLGRDRAAGFTLAPEAATQRLRDAINKGNTDEDLYASVERVFRCGFGKIKLYFMVGLPGETADDIDAIARMANRCVDIGRRHHRRPTVTVSTSTFVPRPHTPLQWARQISWEETLNVQRRLKKMLSRPGLYYRWHDARMSRLEGIMCRGGPELADVIWRAFAMGARFDGWDEKFDEDLWRRAFEECGIEPDGYLAERGRGDAFPWDHVYADLDREFLWREYGRAQRGLATPSCADGTCARCGVCDGDGVRNRTYAPEDVCADESPAPRRTGAPAAPSAVMRIRMRFSKRGRAAYLGHLELVDALRRALRCAGAPMVYTGGYHPRPRMSVGRALPVGIESLCEFADVWLAGDVDGAALAVRMNARMPSGMAIDAVERLPDGAPSIEESIAASTYEVVVSRPVAFAAAADIYRQRTSFTTTVVRKGIERAVDLKGAITGLAVAGDSVIRLALSHGGPSVKVGEVLSAVFGLDADDVRDARITKVDVTFAT